MSERGSIQDYASGLRASRGPDDRWLSIYEAAAMTLQHPDTVRRWVAEGLVRWEDRGRLGIRIPESEVERLVHRHFIDEGRNPADKGLSSVLLGGTRTGAPPVRAADVGWPFLDRSAESSES